MLHNISVFPVVTAFFYSFILIGLSSGIQHSTGRQPRAGQETAHPAPERGPAACGRLTAR
jgi:hypothetical protein